MSRPKIIIENHGNVYFCCKCCFCGKDCKCEGSKCSCMIKINDHPNGKVMIGKKSSKEQVEQSMTPHHGTICLDCKGGCEDDKKMVSHSRSKRSKRSSSEHQSEKHRSLSAGSSPASTAREPSDLEYKVGLENSSTKSEEYSRSESKKSRKSRRKSRRSASKEKILERELEKSGEFKRSAVKDKVLEELLDNSRKSRRSSKSSRKSKKSQDSSLSASTAQNPSSLDNSRKSKRSSKHRKSKKSLVESSFSASTDENPIYLRSRVGPSEQAPISSQSLPVNDIEKPAGPSEQPPVSSQSLPANDNEKPAGPSEQAPASSQSLPANENKKPAESSEQASVSSQSLPANDNEKPAGSSKQVPISSQSLPANDNEQPAGKAQCAQRLFGTSERVSETVHEMRKEDRGSGIEKSTETAKEKKSRGSKKSSRSSKKSRGSKKSSRSGKKSRGSKKSDRTGKEDSKKQLESNLSGSKHSSKFGEEMRKSDRELANQLNSQEFATNEIVTARESKSLINVNASPKDNVQGKSASKTSIDAEDIERKSNTFAKSTYLAPQVESGRSKRLDITSSDQQVNVATRKFNVSDGVAPKIGGESVYLTPQMSSSRPNRLSAVTSERTLNIGQEDGKKRKDRLNIASSERKLDVSQKNEQVGFERKTTDRSSSKIGGQSVYLSPQMDSGRSKRLEIGSSDIKRESLEDCCEKAESELKINLEGELERSKSLETDNSSRKIDANQGSGQKSSERSESVEQSESEMSERNLNISDGSEYADPQLRSNQVSSLSAERRLSINKKRDESTPKAHRRKSVYVDPRLESHKSGYKRSSSKSSERKMEAHQISNDGSTGKQESNDTYYMQQKEVKLLADVDGKPVDTRVTLNIKTRKKDSQVEMKEMWVDGKRVFSQTTIKKEKE